MKKITALLLLGAAFTACTSPENKGYEINGNLADSTLNNQKLYLLTGDSIIDSTTVKNRDFAFAGSIDSAGVFAIAQKIQHNGKERLQTHAQVLLEKGTKVSIKFGEKIVMEDNGGDNQKWSAFVNKFQDKYNGIRENYMKLVEAQVSADSLERFAITEEENLEKLWKNEVEQNKENMLGAAIFSDFCNSYDNAADFLTAVKTIKYAHLFPNIQKMKEFFVNLDNTAEGKDFVDFSGKNMEGKDVKLSDYVGKGQYVLVDFWASWCGPCRKEIPNLIAVNKKYKSEHFIVLGVNVWDDTEKCKAAYETEKINYDQIITEEESNATTLYGINGIPQIMLFAPDGKIVKRDLRGDAISSIVKECLKK